MRSFNLVTGEFNDGKSKKPSKGKRPPKKEVRDIPRGCGSCPLAGVRGVRKILGLVRIKQRKVMLWAQSPGAIENARGMELVGKSGQLLWDAAKTVGLFREDFDIQNVLRCRPADSHGREHPPTDTELHCCSIYNEKALEKNERKADVHLVLGKIAAEQLIGKKVRRDTPVFWHEPLNAYVVLADHPSYILRSGGKRAGWVWEEFLLRMRAVRAILTHPGHWGYVRSRGYQKVARGCDVASLLALLDKEDAVGLDIEDGMVDGEKKVLQVNLAWGRYIEKGNWASWKGRGAVVVLYHPQNKLGKADIDATAAMVWEWLKKKTPNKIMQHGSYDLREIRQLTGVRIGGYDEDAQYATYLAHSNLQSYGLHNIAQRCFPEFADYKKMTEGYTNFADIPLSLLVPYGGADSDLALRIWRAYAVPRLRPLLKVYTKAAVTLSHMERRGPLLDYTALKRVNEVIPVQMEALKDKLVATAAINGMEDFNPNAPAQIATLLYDKLGLPQVSGRATGKEVLQVLATKTRITIPTDVLTYRGLAKAKSTYIDGYEKSADANGGELRTRWNLTGAASGRLSSGGSKSKGKAGDVLVNFQNFHGNPLLKNLLVSDRDWRSAMDGIDLDTEVFLALDYSQVEIRMLAEVTQDPLLISQFNSGQDIHCQVGHTLTGWPVEKIAKDKETRKLVKNLHFGIVYGISEGGLYDYLIAKGVRNVTKAKTIRLHRAYFERYTRVKEWIEEQRASVRSKGHTENIFGFRRSIGAWDTSRTTYWGNQAINCVDYETEAWTSRGWLRGPDIKLTDRLLTKNAETGQLEWQHPTGIKLFPDYEGPVHEFASPTFSAVTTPDHRWLVDVCGLTQCRLTRDFTGEGYEKIHCLEGFTRVTDPIIKRVAKVPMWCPMVPNTYFIARRHGKVYVTGNTPIQGAAHTLLLIALALIEMQKTTYKHLQRPVMEVHDALVFFVKLRHLREAFASGRTLLQEATKAYIAKHWGRELCIPLLAEAEMGYCLGSLVEYNGEPVKVAIEKWRQKHLAVEAAAWEKLLPTEAGK